MRAIDPFDELTLKLRVSKHVNWVSKQVTWVPNAARKDEAADAAQFLTRFGYVLLALGAPAGAVLYELAIFVLYPVGIVSLALAAALDPPPGMLMRASGAMRNPLVILALAGLAWAGVSAIWTPFPVAAGQHILKLSLWLISVFVALVAARPHARATDLYLFPIGLALGMATIFLAFVARQYGADAPDQRLTDGALVLVATLFPALGGLVARGRNGWARLLLVGAFVFIYAMGSTPLMVALLVGFAALSFAASDLGRTARDLAWGAAGLMALGPLAVIAATEVAKRVMHAPLDTLPAPFPSLLQIYRIVLHEKLMLVTGHGFESLVRAVSAGIFPALTPHGELVAIWYELGFVGALIAAAAMFIGFNRIAVAPARLAPFLAAAVACNLTLAALTVNLGDMLWTVSLGVAIISSDVAARSQYRSTRPSAANLSLF